MDDDSLQWRVVRAETPSDHLVFKLQRQHSAHPKTGAVHPFWVIRSPSWVNVIALTPDDQVVLVKQYRHGAGRTCVEIPGGLIDPGEAPAQAAARELREETGYEAERWVELGVLDPNPAIQDNACTIFLALDARRTARRDLDETEVIQVSTAPLAEVRDLIARGEVRHTLVISAFFFLIERAGGWRRPDV